MADDITGIVELGVAAVLHVGDAELGHIMGYLPAAAVDEGADDLAAAVGDAGETPGAAAADKVHEQGLGVIVGVVGGGDEVTAQLHTFFFQKFIAQLTGGFFDAQPFGTGVGGHIAPAQNKGDALTLAVALDKERVAHGFGTADAVFVVGGNHVDAAGMHHMQQAHGVHTAGDGTEYLLAAVEFLEFLSNLHRDSYPAS